MSRARVAVERFFTNTAVVSKLEKVQTDWGETREVEKIVIENMPCRRINSRETFKNSNLYTTNDETFTLLFSKDISLKKGCKIALSYKGEFDGNYYVLGNGFEYETHKEILIARE